MTDQKAQARQVFRDIAAKWQVWAGDGSSRYAVIWQRFAPVIAAMEDLDGAGDFLDIGCGTGQLVLQGAKHGLRSTGIDFADEMIEFCRQNARDAGVDVAFEQGDALAHRRDAASLDIASAMGFIEYISPDAFQELLGNVAGWLRPGGRFLVGSRNRLFNVVSMNEFSRIERALGVFDRLYDECLALSEGADAKAALAACGDIAIRYPHPSRHPITGHPVDSRYQYSPGEIVQRAAECGLRARGIYPVNYHALPVSMVKPQHDLYDHVLHAVWERLPAEHRLVPQSSSFVLDLEKSA